MAVVVVVAAADMEAVAAVAAAAVDAVALAATGDLLVVNVEELS
jgi:hypothetical protein